MNDYDAMRAISRAKEVSEKRLQDRKRSLLVLILRYLCDNGYVEAYERLSTEANLSLSRVDVADNVDLLMIIQEYEESYENKYGKKARLVRKIIEEVHAGGGAVRAVLAGRRAIQASSDCSISPVPVSGQMAAKQRRDKGALMASPATGEQDKKAELLERRRQMLSSSGVPLLQILGSRGWLGSLLAEQHQRHQ